VSGQVENPTAANGADAYFARAFRALVTGGAPDDVLRDVAEAARVQTICTAAAIMRVRRASDDPAPEQWSSDGGRGTSSFEDPAITLPVLVDGRVTHVLNLYGLDPGQRYALEDLAGAWELANVAGLVLTAFESAAGSHGDAADHTGVLAREGFEDDVSAILADNGGRAGIFVMRVCDLEQINARWGRDVGDEVLRLVARAMRDAVGSGTIGRLRRHEFGAVIPGADRAETLTAATAARGLAGNPLPILGRHDVRARIAIGAAAGDGTARSVMHLLHGAYKELEVDERAQAEPRSSRFGF
jgi:diguanylate cyclase (GGDEF)-like protein